MREKAEKEVSVLLEEQVKCLDVTEETRRRITNETLIQNAANFGAIKAAYLPITELYIPSDTYQRSLHTTAKKIADVFDDEKCGFLSVRYNPEKIMFEVIDGQHRFVAAKIAGKTSLPCHIITKANSVEKAATYFSQQDDNRIRLTLRDKFRAALVAKDETCLKLNALCKEFLLEIIPTEKCYAKVQGLKELMRLYSLMGEDGVRRTFTVIEQSKWHDQPGAYGEYMIYTIGSLLMEKLDKDTVMSALIKVFKNTTPDAIVAHSKVAYPRRTPKTAVLTYVSQLVKG